MKKHNVLNRISGADLKQKGPSKWERLKKHNVLNRISGADLEQKYPSKWERLKKHKVSEYSFVKV